MNIPDFQIQRLNKALPRLEAHLQRLIFDVRLFNSLTENLDPQVVLQRANEITATAIQARVEYRSMLSDFASLRNTRYGADRANLNSAASRLTEKFSELNGLLGKLKESASDGINRPGRWGDAAADGPVKSLVDVLGALLEIWVVEKSRLLSRSR